jgi:hypothetical protein
VRMDLVIAGNNALAVDRVCLDAMGLPQAWVQHLTYATLRGLGPADLDDIDVRGDAYTPRPFAQPPVPPTVWQPMANPASFVASSGQQTEITHTVDSTCQTLVEVVWVTDFGPALVPVRLLRDWQVRSSGAETLTWNGRDNAGRVVPPGLYTIRVRARHDESPMVSYATGRVIVRG